MDRKTRDFYHIQDKLSLRWRYAASDSMTTVSAIYDVERKITALTIDLDPLPAAFSELLDLYDQKISMLQSSLSAGQKTGGED